MNNLVRQLQHCCIFSCHAVGLQSTLSKETHAINALTALHKLHASDSRLRTFVREELKQLQLKENLDVQVLPENFQWKDFLGSLNSEDIIPLSQYFTSELLRTEEKMDRVREFVIQLMPGLGGAAFHGTILLGWVLHETTSDALLLAEGLAYMTAYYEPIVALEDTTFGNSSLVDILNSIKPEGKFKDAFGSDWKRKYPVYQQRYSQLVRKYQKQLEFYISQWDINDVSAAVEELVLCATSAFVTSGGQDFFLLHGVTSCLAITEIENCFPRTTKYLEITKLFLRYYGLALLVAFICQGCPDLHSSKSIELLAWKDIETRLTAENSEWNDAHAIKLVWACKHFTNIYPQREALFQQAATLTIQNNLKDPWCYIIGAGFDNPASFGEIYGPNPAKL